MVDWLVEEQQRKMTCGKIMLPTGGSKTRVNGQILGTDSKTVCRISGEPQKILNNPARHSVTTTTTHCLQQNTHKIFIDSTTLNQ